MLRLNECNEEKTLKRRHKSYLMSNSLEMGRGPEIFYITDLNLDNHS